MRVMMGRQVKAQRKVLYGLGPSGCLSVFSHPGRSMETTASYRLMTDEEYDAAHIYVLLNCEELGPFIDRYELHVKACSLQITDAEVERLRERGFARWLKNLVKSERHGIDRRIMDIAQGPNAGVTTFKGYFVNGFHFALDAFDISGLNLLWWTI